MDRSSQHKSHPSWFAPSVLGHLSIAFGLIDLLWLDKNYCTREVRLSTNSVPDPADSEGPQPLHPTVEVRSAPHLRKSLFFKTRFLKKDVVVVSNSISCVAIYGRERDWVSGLGRYSVTHSHCPLVTKDYFWHFLMILFFSILWRTASLRSAPQATHVITSLCCGK